MNDPENNNASNPSPSCNAGGGAGGGGPPSTSHAENPPAEKTSLPPVPPPASGRGTPPWNTPAIWLATWFGCGLLKPAPGTWGTLAALPFGVFMLAFGGWPVLLAGVIVVSAIGMWAADQYEKRSGTHDASQIVIDEVAGIWITLLTASLNPISITLAFLLFRAFDIIKPWPIGWADRRLPGALGVMTDDILAGIISAVILFGLEHYAHIG